LERATFVFFLLGVGCVPGIGVANVCLALCLASALAWRWQARRAGEDFLGPFRRTTPVHAPIGAFVLLSVVSCVFSTLPSRSLIQIKGFGTFLLVVFAAALLDDEADVKLAVDVWRTTALYLVLRGFAEWISGSPSLDFRISGGLSVYMTYAGLLLVFVPLLGARGISGGARAARGADAAVALLGSLAIMLTLTRGAYLGLAIGVLAALLASRPRLALLAPVAIVLFLVLMPLPVRDRLASATNPNDVTLNDRVAMWKAGRAMIADHPLFGVGPGRVKPLYPAYRVPGWITSQPGHLHNNVVMIAAETGILSLLAYLAFVGAFFHGALQIVRRAPRGDRARGVALGAVGAMAALFAAGMFEYNFGDVEVLMATLVVATLPFAAARVTRPAD
jgi:O-antigen ligase